MGEHNNGGAYAAAGVDVTAGYRGVELMGEYVKRTNIAGVLSGIGGFGGLFEPDISGMKRPVFVSGTDGVGTKIKLAMLLEKHNTIGIDCVAMCVNDIICAGAKPLFFLDYIAIGKNIPEKVAEIVSGVAEGCVRAGCALIGGETAEHPGMMAEDEYDLAGFSVGMVDHEKIIDRSKVKAGDIIIGLDSSGVHSNGFSLIRRVFGIDDNWKNPHSAELGANLGDVLLTPTAIYVKPLLDLIEQLGINGAAHITGGGFYENIPRMLGDGLRARIDKSALNIPPVFEVIAKTGNIDRRDMFATFNMGCGMTLAVSKENAQRAVEILRESGCGAGIIGEVILGEAGVDIL